MSYASDVREADRGAGAIESGQQAPGRYESDAKVVCQRSIEIMSQGTFADFEAVYHADFVNHEAKNEPPETRGPYGPAAAYATALWLRQAFADLRWEVHQVIAEGELVSIYCTMHGRHVNTFVGYDEKARVKDAFPPTGQCFASTQTHWFRVTDGKVIEHWANRDDMGTALQLGWLPPTPVYLLRMTIARWRARRAGSRTRPSVSGSQRPA